MPAVLVNVGRNGVFTKFRTISTGPRFLSDPAFLLIFTGDREIDVAGVEDRFVAINCL